MTIIFAENFSQDTHTSIVQRYHASTMASGAVADLPANAYPIQATGDFFCVPFPVFDAEVNTRLEIVLQVGGTYGTYTGAAGVNFFGFTLAAANNASVVTVNGVQTNGLTGDMLRQAQTLHFIFDVLAPNAYQLTFVVDGVPYLNRLRVALPQFTTEIKVLAANPHGMPRYVSSVVVAYDTTANTMLSNLAFVERVPTLTGANWTPSSTTLEGDTNKTDPLDDSTYISTADLPAEGAPVTMGVVLDSPPANLLGTKLYLAGTRDYQTPTSMNVGTLNGPLLLTTQPNAIESVAETFNLNLVNGGRNNDGFEFLGEESPITYADLCTQLGFTAGILMTGTGVDLWLRVRLDGLEMLIPKISVRYELSWYTIYQAGLVYGTDDNGLFPEGTPTNQLRTIVIGGETYKVRLMKGANSESDAASIVGNPAYDVPQIQRSEFSRIYYPLITDDPNIKSYKDNRVGSYTQVDLNLLNAYGNGAIVWCQEARGADRAARGATGTSAFRSVPTTDYNWSSGWRPVLELVPA